MILTREIKSNKYERLKINAGVQYFGGGGGITKINDKISNECRELILVKEEREFFVDINLNCLIFSLINEFSFDLNMWVLVNLTDKVSDG